MTRPATLHGLRSRHPGFFTRSRPGIFTAPGRRTGVPPRRGAASWPGIARSTVTPVPHPDLAAAASPQNRTGSCSKTARCFIKWCLRVAKVHVTPQQLREGGGQGGQVTAACGQPCVISANVSQTRTPEVLIVGCHSQIQTHLLLEELLQQETRTVMSTRSMAQLLALVAATWQHLRNDMSLENHAMRA